MCVRLPRLVEARQPSYRVLHIGPRVRSAQWGRVQLNVYTAAPNVADLKQLVASQQQARAETSERIAILSYAEPGTPLPDAEARRYGAEAQAKYDGTFVCSATIIPGGGFWASAAIALVNTIALLSRAKAPNRVFGDPQEACVWVCSLLEDSSVTPGPLWRAVNRLREEPDADGVDD